MPIRPDRLKDLRDTKGLSQGQLSKLAGLSQSVIAKTENCRNSPGSDVLDKLAQALDCTTDYLLGRGPNYETPAIAATRMAFDVFIRQDDVTDEQRERCSRALRHQDAPNTAQAWRSFLEMMELAKGPISPNTSLTLVEARPPRKKAVGIARRRPD
jgi:transcriptional regulator with XRE-family HTH domain